MADKLGIGIIGTGNIWEWGHSTPLLEHPDVEVRALCDIDEDKAKASAKKHELDVKRVFTDYKDVLALDDVDAVDICTPNYYHSKIAIEALEAGKHVFCEKPDAVDGAEAQRMADASKASGKKLMVMRNNRFREDAKFVKKFIQAGYMGKVYTGRCGWIRRRGIPGKGGWFTTKEMSGGGPLIDLGVHIIDLTIWMMGNPRPVAVTGSTYREFAESESSDSVHSAFGEKKEDGIFDVEDLAIGFIRFENGSSLQIEFSWASNIEEEGSFVELRGTKAGCNLGSGEPKIFTEFEGTLCDVAPRLPKPKMSGHGLNLHHFVDYVLGRVEPIFTPEQGVDMIKILEGIYTSAETGKEVLL